jgi:hypothetical protein
LKIWYETIYSLVEYIISILIESLQKIIKTWTKKKTKRAHGITIITIDPMIQFLFLLILSLFWYTFTLIKL